MMEENNIKALWKTIGEGHDVNQFINNERTIQARREKVRSQLHSMKPVKIFTLVAGIIWIVAGVFLLSDIYINSFREANKFFLFSATFQIGVTTVAAGIYMYQLVSIFTLDLAGSILHTQNRLARLRSSTLLSARILFLQLPAWTTFYLNTSMLSSANLVLMIIQFLATLAFTVAAIWLFFNIKYENRNKRWFRLIFNDKEWTPVLISMKLLEDIEDFNEADTKSVM